MIQKGLLVQAPANRRNQVLAGHPIQCHNLPRTACPRTQPSRPADHHPEQHRHASDHQEAHEEKDLGRVRVGEVVLRDPISEIKKGGGNARTYRRHGQTDYVVDDTPPDGGQLQTCTAALPEGLYAARQGQGCPCCTRGGAGHGRSGCGADRAGPQPIESVTLGFTALPTPAQSPLTPTQGDRNDVGIGNPFLLACTRVRGFNHVGARYSRVADKWLVTARQASPSIGLALGGTSATVALLLLRFMPSQCFVANPSALCRMIEGC